MANIKSKFIQSNGDYVDLAEEMGITFTEGNDYQIQIQNAATVIVSATKPTEGGFYINTNKPFGYTHTGDTLWIKTLQYTDAFVNIAEG